MFSLSLTGPAWKLKRPRTGRGLLVGSGATSVGPLTVLVAHGRALKGPGVVQIVGFAQRINLRRHELSPARIQSLDTVLPGWRTGRTRGRKPRDLEIRDPAG
jgi:hypothetical protein